MKVKFNVTVALASVFGASVMMGFAHADTAWEEVVAAAEREGKVTIIGPPVQPHRDTIMGFEEAYPNIRVEYTGMAPPQFEARLNAERGAGRYLWDILISGMSSTVYERQIPQGWFDPLRPVVVLPEVLDDENWVGGFEAGFLDEKGKYIYAFSAERSGNVGFDTNRVDADSFSYETLLDPRWRGQIAMLDPRGRGPGSVAFRQIVVALGEDGAKKLLKEQDVVLAESPRQVTEWAVRGTYPITVGLTLTDLTIFQGRGIGENIAIYEDPQGFLLTKWGNVALMNGAPNPNASKVFVNWLLTREAQKQWSSTGYVNSRRMDVPLAHPALKVDVDTWESGYNISGAKTAADGVKALRIAEEGLR
ncbi:MAG: substrate-binding domain-containing protein [Aquisalimonadaceae bacterium]